VALVPQEPKVTVSVRTEGWRVVRAALAVSDDVIRPDDPTSDDRLRGLPEDPPAGAASRQQAPVPGVA